MPPIIISSPSQIKIVTIQIHVTAAAAVAGHRTDDDALFVSIYKVFNF
jgi:hypothetical protein